MYLRFTITMIYLLVDAGQRTNHKVRIYKEYHSVLYVPSSDLGLSPLSPASVPLPPEPGGGGGGGHTPAG